MCKASEETIEYCPHHDGEITINANKPSICPECQIEILPCSTCNQEKGCDWEIDKGCWRFPKNNKKMYICTWCGCCSEMTEDEAKNECKFCLREKQSKSE